MAFVKVYKSKAYYKRFQTRFRRRREGKTDYYARKRLIIQDKNKYNTPKYRFVPRITNTRVICQVIWTTIEGDRIYCAADSTELKKYGVTTGLANYAACYATGLLCARRLLAKAGLDKLYSGAAKVDGEEYDVSADWKKKNIERKPFKAILDVGLTRTTNGARIFGCLKGACDGGLNIPHSNRRYPGFNSEGEKESYNAKIHRERIFGGHVTNYMKKIKGDAAAYKLQFSKWDETLKKANVDTLEKLYTKVHDEIRKNPAHAKKDKKRNPVKYTDKRKTVIETAKGKYTRDRRLTREERRKRVEAKLKKAAGKK
jgi:large subunit ribosomal protein L5e